MKKPVLTTLLSTALSLGVAVPTLAQVGIEGRTGPGTEQPELPDFPVEQKDPFEQTPRPPAPPTGSITQAGPNFTIQEVRFTGTVTVFSVTELQAIASTYVGRPLQTTDLIELRDEITRAYVTKGYINSGAVIPDQDVSGGLLSIEIVEGSLTDVHVAPTKHLRAGFLRDKMRRGNTRPPLNINNLRESFLLLQRVPGVDKVNAQLLPGTEPGQAHLNLTIQEARPFFASVVAANDRSPSVGAERIAGQVGYRNLIGHGDILFGEVGKTDGMVDWSVNYDVPLTASGFAARIGYQTTDADVIEKPLNELDIESSSDSYQIGVSYPLLEQIRARKDGRGSVANFWTVSLDYNFRESETSLLDVPFSFSPGAVDGRTEVQTLRLGQDWVHQRATQVLAVHTVFNFGLEGTRPSAEGVLTPNENFISMLAQIQYAHSVAATGGRIVARIDVQETKDTLYAAEKFSIGGETSVRGYRKNQLLTDNGFVASIEYQQPLFKLSLPGLESGRDKNVSGSVFVDGGHGWNNEVPDPLDDVLVSAGIGLNWSPADRITMSASWALQLKDVDIPGSKDLQDHGFSFRVRADLF